MLGSRSRMTNAMKILIDNNVLDELVNLSEDKIQLIKTKCEILYCDTSIREFNDIKLSDQKKYQKIKDLLDQFHATHVSLFGLVDWNNLQYENVSGFSDIDNFSMITYEDVEVYQSIHPNAKNFKKESDRQLALMASANNVDIILTNDNDFYKHLIKTQIKPMKLEEFITYLQSL